MKNMTDQRKCETQRRTVGHSGGASRPPKSTEAAPRRTYQETANMTDHSCDEAHFGRVGHSGGATLSPKPIEATPRRTKFTGHVRSETQI